MLVDDVALLQPPAIGGLVELEVVGPRVLRVFGSQQWPVTGAHLFAELPDGMYRYRSRRDTGTDPEAGPRAPRYQGCRLSRG